MFSSPLHNPFLAWEGEAPAEPWLIKLGRSLALPLVFNAFAIAKMLRGVGPRRRKLGRSLAFPAISDSFDIKP